MIKPDDWTGLSVEQVERFNVWMDQQENFGLRRERAAEDLGKFYAPWLLAAFREGIRAAAEATAGTHDRAATLTMNLSADSGYSSFETHRVSSNQWGRIVAIATEPHPGQEPQA